MSSRRTHTKITGLSKSIVSHTFKHGSRNSQILRAGKQQERISASTSKRLAEIQELPAEDRERVAQMLADHEVQDDGLDFSAPFGDEGIDVSNEGGEYAVYEGLAQEIADLTGFRRIDPRTRHDRVERQNEHWALQTERLVAAYLEYREHDSGDGMPQTEAMEAAAEGTECPSLANVELIDIFSRNTTSLSTRSSHVYPNETLIYHGYLGSSPLYPTVAISIRTLAAYRQAHRTCPRFSIQAQCKALCHMHNVPYRPFLASQFSDAYDIYLEIIYRVDHLLKVALKRDAPDWRMKNACPACFYKLKDEPQLELAYLTTMDGNNSLKRWPAWTHGGTSRTDSRGPRLDYWLSAQDVDKFKDEVRARPPNPNEDDPQDDWEDDPNIESEEFDCVKRWRNAGPEQRKRMFKIFDETGIFIAACRHRFVLIACDMIRSGELAKYPLAVVDKLLSVYGANGGCAYDIGCAFAKTLSNSSMGSRARQLNFHMMVGAFHGHAHNRKCQLQWHPTYISGTGHSEGEGCEHIFSSSNDQARSTRHATAFHRHQTIEEHFAFWDADKYAALSNFLRNHYREALTAVRTLEAELAIVKSTYNLSDDDFLRFFNEEKVYLDSLQHPPVDDRLKIRYVEVLDELTRCKVEWEDARNAANNALNTAPVGAGFDQIHATLLQARKRVDTAYTKLQNAEALAAHMELQLVIDERWVIGGPEYERFKAEASLRSYRAALDELERLVVMRLFELSRLSLSGTGYKLRQQIGKALQRRSQAIRNAITRYNQQATALNPPRPTVSWKEIAAYTFLGEFDLLRQSRADIRGEDWTKPALREALVKHFKLQRAHEEIIRLNIEIRRLRTAIRDEAVHMTQIIAHLLNTNRPLGLELQRQWKVRAGVNAVHLYRLDQIELLPGFSGIRGVGVRDAPVSEPRGTVASSNLESASESASVEATRIISTEYVDADILEQEEHSLEMQNIDQYLDSIID